MNLPNDEWGSLAGEDFTTRSIKNPIISTDLTGKPKQSWLVRLWMRLRRSLRRWTATITRQPTVEILRVTQQCQGEPEHLDWGWVGEPQRGDRFRGSVLAVDGWVVGKTVQPRLLQVRVNGAAIAQTTINIPRPDVIKAHFYDAAFHNCGYRVVLDVKTLPEEALIELNAVFPDGFPVLIGTVQFCKYGF